MKKSLPFAVFALASLPVLFTATSSHAADFDYGYAELIYVRGDFKDASLIGGKVTLDGFAAELSYEYSPSIAVGGRLLKSSADFDVITMNEGNKSAEMDLSVYSVFALYHDSINDKADYFAGVAIGKSDGDISVDGTRNSELSGKDDVRDLFGGVRYHYSEEIELQFDAEFDTDADDDEFSFGIGAKYQVAADLSIGANFSLSDDRGVAVSLRKDLF